MAGTYVSVKPFPLSCEMLYDEFNKFLRHKMTPEREMHVTLIYSKQTIPEAKNFSDPDMKFQGTFRRLNWWAGHDKLGYLVLEIDSRDLHHRHEFWKTMGGQHSFRDYSPHLTLATGIQRNEIIHVMNSYNSDPNGLDLPCAFNKEFVNELRM